MVSECRSPFLPSTKVRPIIPEVADNLSFIRDRTCSSSTPDVREIFENALLSSSTGHQQFSDLKFKDDDIVVRSELSFTSPSTRTYHLAHSDSNHEELLEATLVSRLLLCCSSFVSSAAAWLSLGDIASDNATVLPHSSDWQLHCGIGHLRCINHPLPDVPENALTAMSNQSRAKSLSIVVPLKNLAIEAKWQSPTGRTQSDRTQF